MIPVSESAEAISERPVSKAIKQALDNIEGGKKRKEEIMRETVEELANLNCVDELMQVYQGQKQKDAVFLAIKTQFNEKFTKLAEQDQLIQASNKVIQENFADFSKLKASVAIDPTRQAFFQRIDLALMSQQDLENMLSQGLDFYSRLIDHLTILKQNVTDFKNARTMQASDVCKQLGVPPPNSQPMPSFLPNINQNPGAFNYGYDPNI